ncbi:hypothetical protein [Cellulosimicrobium marinum]|uniref:hypothetical protein n=1 Tax=Cellulosimicrobium marinum TaxID=1638992 RepID=UPI001E363295|nr:hypothetical protein [Cellulosimicrobium marinum]MCB7136705.1 hypothetical protein [Cellulosimicrobium marinum]
MKKRLAPLAAAALTIGLIVVPAAGASAATKSRTYDCGTRDARITASAPTNVSLTVNGTTRSARNSAGAAVTLYDYDGKGTAKASSTDSSVSISVVCF